MFSSFYDFIKNLFPLSYEKNSYNDKKDTAKLFDANTDMKATMDKIMLSVTKSKFCTNHNDCTPNVCGNMGDYYSSKICC